MSDASSFSHPESARQSASVQWAQCPVHAATLQYVDLETTGLYPKRGARITEVAVVRREACRSGGDVRVDWRRDDGGPLADVLPSLMDVLAEAVVVGHNIGFDIRFLASTADRLRLAGPRLRCVDTLALARRLVDDVPDYRLETLLNWAGIAPDGPLHTALVDARATRALFWRLVDHGDVETLADAGLMPVDWSTF